MPKRAGIVGPFCVIRILRKFVLPASTLLILLSTKHYFARILLLYPSETHDEDSMKFSKTDCVDDILSLSTITRNGYTKGSD